MPNAKKIYISCFVQAPRMQDIVWLSDPIKLSFTMGLVGCKGGGGVNYVVECVPKSKITCPKEVLQNGVDGTKTDVIGSYGGRVNIQFMAPEYPSSDAWKYISRKEVFSTTIGPMAMVIYGILQG